MDNGSHVVRKSGGAKGIDWERARLLYAQGWNPTRVAAEVGCRREEVSRRCSREEWVVDRTAVRTATTQRVVSALADNSKQFLVDTDDMAGLGMEALRLLFADELKRARKARDSKAGMRLKLLSEALLGLQRVRRSARGMSATEGMGTSAEDRRLEVVIRTLPRTKLEYDAMMAAERATEPHNSMAIERGA